MVDERRVRRLLQRVSDDLDSLEILGRKDVLDPALADSLARAVGFRNVLVQGYVDADDDRVVAQLDRLEELRAFVTVVSRWIG